MAAAIPTVITDRMGLFTAMVERKFVTLNGRYQGQGVIAKGFVQGLDIEDGSGYNFLVKFADGNSGVVRTIFVSFK